MNYKPLPEIITLGMTLACPKYYDPPEVLEVIKIDDETGRIWLRRENETSLLSPMTVELLQRFDYMLVEKK